MGLYCRGMGARVLTGLVVTDGVLKGPVVATDAEAQGVKGAVRWIQGCWE